MQEKTKRIKRFAKYYKIFAVIILNTIILFLLLNLFFYIVIEIREDRITSDKYYSDEILKEIYPNLSQEDINLLLKEFKSLFQKYKPYVQFTEPEFKGKFVNIDKNGFRNVKEQCGFPLDKNKFNIFVFGGSTTLGYGVSDTETIPSYLQENLLNYCSDVCVYNFGQGGYFSTQERVFFETLLLEENKPNMIIFIDGLNDFYILNNEPLHTKRLKQYMERRTDFSDEYGNLPLFRAVNYFIQNENTETKDEDESIKTSFNRLIANHKIINSIADDFNVKTYFVIQPVPVYNYNLTYHIPYSRKDYANGFGRHIRAKEGYVLLRAYYNNLSYKEKKNIIWLADIQDNETKNLYVDIVHYNPEFNKKIAENIANRIKSNVC